MVLMESELWPRMLHECAFARIPVIVANARISDRSFPRYRALRVLWKPLLSKVTLFLAQGEESARRLQGLGVPAERIRSVGNLKYDAPAPARNALVEALRANLPAADFIVCGSTVEGEEEQVLKAWLQLMSSGHRGVLLIAPRHPQRFAAVSRLVGQSGIRISEWMQAPRKLGLGDILVLDTLGSLAAVYQLATVAFLGGSLVKKGGHNPLEAARFAVPVVMGPSYQNFREIVEGMRSADAIYITEQNDLSTCLHIAMARGRAVGRRGEQFFLAQTGATARTLALIHQVLEKRVDALRRPWALPLVPPYAAALGLKNLAYRQGWLRPVRLARPVISIGSLSAGGAGKTPVVLALAKLCEDRGVRVDVLSRGFGRRSNAVEEVRARRRRFGVTLWR